MAAGFLLFFLNCVISQRRGRKAGANPWGGDSLEWSMSSPPPTYSFLRPPVVRSRHPLWMSDAHESHDPWLEKVRAALHCAPLEWRATLVTDAFHARPEAVQPLPGPSTLPLIVALGVLIAFVGVLGGVYLLSVGGIIATIVAVAGWLWPDRGRLEMLRDSALPTAAGLPLFPTGNRSTGWWGMVCFLAVLGTAFGALFYSYFYLQLFSAHWPQGSIARPHLGLAGAGVVFAVAGAVLTWAGGRSFRRQGDLPVRLLAGAIAAGLGSAACYALALVGLPFTARENAYGSIFWLTSGTLFVPLSIALVFSAALLKWEWKGEEDRDLLGLPMDLALLIWYGTGVAALAVFAVLYVSPYVIG